MQDDHDLENGPEEGEYHFSDEGVYETAVEEMQAPEIAEKTGLGARFTSYRRFIILGGIFAGVLLVVYLLIAPPTVPTPTEITTASSSTAPHSEAPVKTVASQSPSVSPKIESEKNKMESVTKAKESDNISAPPPVQTVAEVPAPFMPPAQSVVASLGGNPPDMGSTLSSLPGSPMVTASTQQPLPSQIPDKVIVDRLAALEEANTRMISQLNAEYAHRLADFETQDKALQEQIRALTAKISGMEAQLSQMQQLNRQQTSPPPTNEGGNQINVNVNDNSGNTSTLTLPSSEMASPNKTNYAVQAIIPGRAWLRTESGETVTVAEGDLLKGIGRVTKIDPYDGTIQIDTGTKMILLSYGNGDYT